MSAGTRRRNAMDLCGLDDIADGAGRAFRCGDGAMAYGVIVVRRGGRVWAYANNCPHNHIPLDALHPRFVTHDGEWIVCSTHDAVFRFEDGYCEDGPCKGRNLEPIAITVIADRIHVDPAPAPDA